MEKETNTNQVEIINYKDAHIEMLSTSKSLEVSKMNIQKTRHKIHKFLIIILMIIVIVLFIELTMDNNYYEKLVMILVYLMER